MLIGLTAALSPGPLMALIIGETLRYGRWAGMQIAIVPFLTDLPFVFLAVTIALELRSFAPALGILSMLGGILLLSLGIQNLRAKTIQPSHHPSSRSMMKGILLNLLNPYPYVLWFSIGSPIFARGTLLDDAAFAGALMFTSVLTMIVLVLLVEQLGKLFLPVLHWIIRILGIVLLFYALVFFRAAWGYLV
ncbi:LysE family transporter [Candidatus Peregrinibacteria bacterium]|nr:LysE family transporter [Candidatus Peregrinibacteria bacterium]